MTGKPDTSDDLIAELAKLMAQDANGDRPAAGGENSPKPSEPFTLTPVRIPGGPGPEASTPPAPKPPAEPSVTVPQAAQPVVPPRPVAAQVDAPTPVPRFDFSQPDAPTPAAPTRQEPTMSAPVAWPTPPAPQPDAPNLQPPRSNPVEAQGQRPPASSGQPAFIPTSPKMVAEDHDAIADLIAAEFSTKPTPPVTPRPPAPTPAAPKPPTQEQGDNFKVAPVFGLGGPPPSKPVMPDVGAAPRPVFQSGQSGTVQPPAAQSGGAPNQQTRQQPSFAAPVAPAQADARPPIANDELRDPIEEIDSLIGQTTPNERPAPAATRPNTTPSLRSLATPSLPTPAPPQPASKTITNAEEAIFAAAAASGARLDWIDAPTPGAVAPAPKKRGKEPKIRPPKAVREPKVRAPRREGARDWKRALVGPAIALLLLLVAGVGLYSLLGRAGTSGDAPVLTADSTPVKEVPVTDPNAAAPSQSVVFNELDGVSSSAEDEQLVSRDQSQTAEVPPATTPGTPGADDTGLANRKVRTVTVRPDGTIVSADNSSAGSALLPVERPNVPELPAAEGEDVSDLLASIARGEAGDANAVPPTTPEGTTVAPEATSQPVPTPGTEIPAVDVAGNPIAGRQAPVPMQRPSTFRNTNAAVAPVNAVIDTAPSALALAPAQSPATPAQQAPAQQAPARQATAVAAASGSNAPAYVQLSSQRTEETARSTANAIQQRYGSLFAGAQLEIQRIDLAERGIYYRVRLPAASAANAAQICAGVKANGGDCFTL